MIKPKGWDTARLHDTEQPVQLFKRSRFEASLIHDSLLDDALLPAVSDAARQFPQAYRHFVDRPPPPLTKTTIRFERTHVDAGILRVPLPLLTAFVGELTALLTDPPWSIMQTCRGNRTNREPMLGVLDGLAWFIESCPTADAVVVVEIESFT